jgi:hypothetical protein
MVEPSKEVGHDKKRSLVMPMGISLSELSCGVARNCLWLLSCIAGEQLEAPSSSSRRPPRRGNGNSAVS